MKALERLATSGMATARPTCCRAAVAWSGDGVSRETPDAERSEQESIRRTRHEERAHTPNVKFQQRDGSCGHGRRHGSRGVGVSCETLTPAPAGRETPRPKRKHGCASPLPAPGKPAAAPLRKRHVSSSSGSLDTGKIVWRAPVGRCPALGTVQRPDSVSHETLSGGRGARADTVSTRQLLSATAGRLLRGGRNSRNANSSAPLPHARLIRLLHEGPRTPGNIWDGNCSTDVLPCRGGVVWGWCFTGNTRRDALRTGIDAEDASREEGAHAKYQVPAKGLQPRTRAAARITRRRCFM